MKSVVCPYCDARSYTSSPEIMARCSSCGRLFAEVVTVDGEVMVIIDNSYPDAEDFARELTAKWQASGGGRVAIVDRRRNEEDYGKQDRRRYRSD